MTYLGDIGEGCRLRGLRGRALYVSCLMGRTPFPAGECGLGECGASCCMDGCRMSYEDFVELAPFMAETCRVRGIARATISYNLMGVGGEPGYEETRGFLQGNRHNKGCIFLDPAGACMLHGRAIELGMDWRRMKPFTCVLYPVRMLHIDSGRGIVLLPSREHSICRNLTCRRGAKRSHRNYMEAKGDDIRALFDLQAPGGLAAPGAE